MKIAIESFVFAPQAIDVKVGQRVEFTNNDQVPHSVVIETADGRTLRSNEQMDEGETFSVILESPGEATYFCGLHPGMKGKITVTK